jgi:hypothetical protein
MGADNSVGEERVVKELGRVESGSGMSVDGMTVSGRGRGIGDEEGEEVENVGSGDSVGGCCGMREEGWCSCKRGSGSGVSVDGMTVSGKGRGIGDEEGEEVENVGSGDSVGDCCGIRDEEISAVGEREAGAGIENKDGDSNWGVELPEADSCEGSSEVACSLAGKEDSSNTTWRER